MKIFISWSGETSKQIAEIFNNWLPSVIQLLKPFYSKDDIGKGKRWSLELSKQLETTNFGVILVTKENIDAPWILFEAGALSKNIINGRVCTILFDLKDTDLEGPLAQFQHTFFSKKEIFKLVTDLNLSLERKAIKTELLKNIFEKMWPDLDKEVSKILRNSDGAKKSSKDIRGTKELIEEVLRIVRKSQYKYLDWGNSELFEHSESDVKFIHKDKQINFYERNHKVYSIQLHQLSTTSQILDFILQVNSKGWCTPKHIKDFLDCLEELTDEYFETNAQGVFCPFSAFMKIDWTKKTYENIK